MTHALALTLCLAAAAQIAARIEGVVRDRNGAPIAGAKVTAELVSAFGARLVEPRLAEAAQQRSRSAETDLTGTFEIEVAEAGTYNISVRADGYLQASPLEGRRLVEVASAAGGAGPTSYRVDPILDRPATLKARLLDGISKQGIASHLVELHQVRHFRGAMTLLPLVRRMTATDGTLLIENIPPGDYFLQMQPSVREALGRTGDGVLSGDASSRARGYLRAFLPEYANQAYAHPIRIESGASLDLGSFEVSRHALFRVSGTIEFTTCGESDRYTLGLVQRHGGNTVIRVNTTLQCAQGFSIDNLGPGSYELNAWIQNREIGEREIVRLPIEVIDRDLHVAPRATMPLHLSGTVLLPPQAPGDLLADLKVRMMPVGTSPFAEEASPVTVEGDGRFTLVWTQRVQGELAVLGLKAPYFVKSVAYNSSLAHGSILTPDPYAAEQRIDIVVGDRPAVIRGRVTAKGVAVPGAVVLVASWPLTLRGGYPVFTSGIAEADGSFSVQGLPSGTYRTVAVDSSARRRLERSDVAVSLFSGGREVNVSEGGMQSVDLELSPL